MGYDSGKVQHGRVLTVLVTVLAVGGSPLLADKSVEISRLTNGIHVKKTEGVKLIAAYWRVVIVIPPPPFAETEINDYYSISQLYDYVSRESAAAIPIDRGIRQHLLDRLDLILTRMQHQMEVNEPFWKKKTSRERRGLINAGGWLLGKLFGVATSKDVAQIRALIQQGQERQEVLSHKVGELASAYNKMVKEENITRGYLEEHRRAIGKLQEDIKILYGYTNRTYQLIHPVRKAQLLDDLVQIAERQHAVKAEGWQVFHEQRQALEGGRLTETVLPRSDLQELLEHVEEVGYVGAPKEWYYENSLVRPLWHSQEGLSFIVELPMVEDSVTGYEITTYPDVQPTGNWVRLLAHRNLGYDEKSGNVVMLTACRGVYPTLCEKDLHYRDGLLCERSLILGRPQRVDHCRVRFERPSETTAVTVHTNRFMVTTLDKTLEVRCQGESSELVNIRPGTHLISFNAADCQLQGESGWVLESVDVHTETLEIMNADVNLTDITLPVIPKFEELPPLMQHRLHRVEGVQLKEVEPLPEFHPLSVWTHSSGNTYAVIGCIVVIIGIMCTLIGCGYYHDWCELQEKTRLCCGSAVCLKRKEGKDDQENSIYQSPDYSVRYQKQQEEARIMGIQRVGEELERFLAAQKASANPLVKAGMAPLYTEVKDPLDVRGPPPLRPYAPGIEDYMEPKDGHIGLNNNRECVIPI